MSDTSIKDRGKALEDAFFARQEQALRQRLQDAQDAEGRRQAFAAASGITDEAVLARLTALNIGVETVAALSLVPVVLVAWADGSVDAKEREAALAAAAEAGLDRTGAGHTLLEQWLVKRPSPDLLAAWKDYMRALATSLEPAALERLRADLMGRARRTAEAAGGFLGLGSKVSAAEQAVLDDLDAAFAR